MVASVAMAVLPVVAFAACPIPIDQVTSANAVEWFTCLIERILNFIVWPVFIGLAIIMFVWAGILFLAAHGDPGKIGEAKKAAIWGVVGVVVGLMGYIMVGVLRGLLGL